MRLNMNIEHAPFVTNYWKSKHIHKIPIHGTLMTAFQNGGWKTFRSLPVKDYVQKKDWYAISAGQSTSTPLKMVCWWYRLAFNGRTIDVTSHISGCVGHFSVQKFETVTMHKQHTPYTEIYRTLLWKLQIFNVVWHILNPEDRGNMVFSSDWMSL
jgi:hypothetical protein